MHANTNGTAMLTHISSSVHNNIAPIQGTLESFGLYSLESTIGNSNTNTQFIVSQFCCFAFGSVFNALHQTWHTLLLCVCSPQREVWC